MESYLNFSTNRNRILLSLSALVLLIFLVPDRFKVLEVDIKYMDSTIVASLLIVLAIAIRIESAGRSTGLVNVLILVLCAGIGFMMMQTSQGFIISNVGRAIVFTYNIFICAIILIAGYCITGRFRFSLIVGLTIVAAYAIVGFYILEFRGEALLPVDVLASMTALSIADGFTYEFTGTIFLIILQYSAALAWALKTTSKAKTPKKQFQIRSTVMLFCCVGVFTFLDSTPEMHLESFNPGRYLNGYPFEIAVQSKLLNIKAPVGYTPDAVADIVNNDRQSHEIASTSTSNLFGSQDSSSETSGLPQNPNIIVVMNESFADLRIYNDFETNMPVMPFIDELRNKENVISGFTEVNVFGGGTCDSEYSVLTGNSTAFLPASARPYQLYMEQDAPSIANNLKRQGYATYAIHPGGRTAWNRDVAYEKMGFDEFFSEDSFSTEDMVRDAYISDADTYERIIQLYENKGDQPIFVHNVTIANHCGYTEENTNGLRDVHLTGKMYNDYPSTDQYLALLRRSDDDLSELINYFKKADEPTIILFFGDHQASIETSFYEKLIGKPQKEWTAEEFALQYQTPYLIWANYDIDEGDSGTTAVHNLGQKLLSQTGVDQSAYFEYLERLEESNAIISKTGVVDKDGNRLELNEAEKQNIAIANYRKVLYNSIIDTKKRLDELYTVDELQMDSLKSDYVQYDHKSN